MPAQRLTNTEQQADYHSQLNIKLSGYDQVVAISQQNINTVLKYKFLTNPNLRGKQTNNSGKWTFESPTVELVDLPNGGDGALLFTKLRAPSTFDFLSGDGTTKPISVAGSILAFTLRFKLESVKRLPEDIASEISEPGSYTASQLVLDFTAASLSTFNPSKSTLVGFDSYPAAKDGLVQAVAKYLQELAAAGTAGVLGSALTTIKPELMHANTATSPPTSVSLQTVYYKPYDGSGTQSSESKNAFLFTEMCGNRRKPLGDLPWTGNWFCPPISGTMVVSKRVFWDNYLVPKFNPLKTKNLDFLNDLSKKLGMNEEAKASRWHLFKKNKRRRKQKGSYAIRGETEYSGTIERPAWEPNVSWAYKIESGFESNVVNEAGSGKATYLCEAKLRHEYTLTILGQGATITRTASLQTQTSVNFVSTDKGMLSAETKLESCHADYNEDMNLTPFLQKVMDIVGNVIQVAAKPEMNKFKTSVESNIKELLANMKLAEGLEKQLNGQQKFIFSGGGTFAMKDPSFNREGDLMVGLTYKLRARDDNETLRRELGLDE